MTMLEKLAQVLGDGQWRSTKELVEQVGHRFFAVLHQARASFDVLVLNFELRTQLKPQDSTLKIY